MKNFKKTNHVLVTDDTLKTIQQVREHNQQWNPEKITNDSIIKSGVNLLNSPTWRTILALDEFTADDLVIAVHAYENFMQYGETIESLEREYEKELSEQND